MPKIEDKPTEGELDLGRSHYARFFHYGDPEHSYAMETTSGLKPTWGQPIYPDDGPLETSRGLPVAGVIVRHINSQTKLWCEGSATFWTPKHVHEEEKWKLESLDPLHIEPSLRCHCGDHGHIRGGKWQPA